MIAFAKVFVTHLTTRGEAGKAIDGHAFVRSGPTRPVELVLRLARVESQLQRRRAARGIDRVGLAGGPRGHRLVLNDPERVSAPRLNRGRPCGVRGHGAGLSTIDRRVAARATGRPIITDESTEGKERRG